MIAILLAHKLMLIIIWDVGVILHRSYLQKEPVIDDLEEKRTHLTEKEVLFNQYWVSEHTWVVNIWKCLEVGH